MWDLDGTCTFHNVTENLSVPAKRTQTTVEMAYPKSKDPKPVYFLLLRLFSTSDKTVISRNFYWLHLPGGDYKLLEQYRMKRVPLTITSKASINGSTYNVKIHVENTSQRRIFNRVPYKNNAVGDNGHEPESLGAQHNVKHELGLLHQIYRHLSSSDDGLGVVKVESSDCGVAFFLRLSVHAAKLDSQEGEDTRILPVHYSDNYFSLVPGETMSVDISFEVPSDVSPLILLHGWNYCDGISVYRGR